MRMEYIGLSELSGSLIALQGVEDVAFDEVAEITLDSGERRYGRVILIDGDRVVLQVFEGTKGISLENARTHFTGKPMDIALSREMLGRVFDGAGRPIDNVKIMSTDIERIKGVLTAQDTVSRIYINFCNPWSKNASSNKHRLTYPRQLIQYREFLKDGGEIYFKTDDDDLFRDSLEYFPASGYEITWKTFDLHENEPEWNIRTEHEGMFTEMGIKIKALIARKKPGDDSVTWIEPKVLKRMAREAAEAEAAAKAAQEGESNV